MLVCLKCEKPLTGKQKKFCCHNHKGEYNHKVRYGYKYKRLHRTKTVLNYLKHLVQGRRDRENLTAEMLEDMYNNQKGLCAISGTLMTYSCDPEDFNSNISIDQIVPSKGYYLGNIQLVCSIVNTMKWRNTKEELVEWCKAILEHQEEGSYAKNTCQTIEGSQKKAD